MTLAETSSRLAAASPFGFMRNRPGATAAICVEACDIVPVEEAMVQVPASKLGAGVLTLPLAAEAARRAGYA